MENNNQKLIKSYCTIRYFIFFKMERTSLQPAVALPVKGDKIGSKKRLSRLGRARVSCVCGRGSVGLPQVSPLPEPAVLFFASLLHTPHHVSPSSTSPPYFINLFHRCYTL